MRRTIREENKPEFLTDIPVFPYDDKAEAYLAFCIKSTELSVRQGQYIIRREYGTDTDFFLDIKASNKELASIPTFSDDIFDVKSALELYFTDKQFEEAETRTFNGFKFFEKKHGSCTYHALDANHTVPLYRAVDGVALKDLTRKYKRYYRLRSDYSNEAVFQELQTMFVSTIMSMIQLSWFRKEVPMWKRLNRASTFVRTGIVTASKKDPIKQRNFVGKYFGELILIFFQRYLHHWGIQRILIDCYRIEADLGTAHGSGLSLGSKLNATSAEVVSTVSGHIAEEYKQQKPHIVDEVTEVVFDVATNMYNRLKMSSHKLILDTTTYITDLIQGCWEKIKETMNLAGSKWTQWTGQNKLSVSCLLSMFLAHVWSAAEEIRSFFGGIIESLIGKTAHYGDFDFLDLNGNYTSFDEEKHEDVDPEELIEDAGESHGYFDLLKSLGIEIDPELVKKTCIDDSCNLKLIGNLLAIITAVIGDFSVANLTRQFGHLCRNVSDIGGILKNYAGWAWFYFTDDPCYLTKSMKVADMKTRLRRVVTIMNDPSNSSKRLIDPAHIEECKELLKVMDEFYLSVLTNLDTSHSNFCRVFGLYHQILRKHVAASIAPELLKECRVTPLGIVMTGDPGAGKSFLVDALAKHFYVTSVRPRMPEAPEYNNGCKFAMPNDSEYRDHYDRHKIITHAEFLTSTDSEINTKTAFEYLEIQSSAVKAVNCAALEMKSCKVYEHWLHIADTNRKFSQFNVIGLTKPEAILRRIDFPIRVERGEYVQEKTIGILDDEFKQGFNKSHRILLPSMHHPSFRHFTGWQDVIKRNPMISDLELTEGNGHYHVTTPVVLFGLIESYFDYKSKGLDLSSTVFKWDEKKHADLSEYSKTAIEAVLNSAGETSLPLEYEGLPLPLQMFSSFKYYVPEHMTDEMRRSKVYQNMVYRLAMHYKQIKVKLSDAYRNKVEITRSDLYKESSVSQQKYLLDLNKLEQQDILNWYRKHKSVKGHRFCNDYRGAYYMDGFLEQDLQLELDINGLIDPDQYQDPLIEVHNDDGKEKARSEEEFVSASSSESSHDWLYQLEPHVGPDDKSPDFWVADKVYPSFTRYIQIFDETARDNKSTDFRRQYLLWSVAIIAIPYYAKYYMDHSGSGPNVNGVDLLHRMMAQAFNNPSSIDINDEHLFGLFRYSEYVCRTQGKPHMIPIDPTLASTFDKRADDTDTFIEFWHYWETADVEDASMLMIYTMIMNPRFQHEQVAYEQMRVCYDDYGLEFVELTWMRRFEIKFLEIIATPTFKIVAYVLGMLALWVVSFIFGYIVTWGIMKLLVTPKKIRKDIEAHEAEEGMNEPITKRELIEILAAHGEISAKDNKRSNARPRRRMMPARHIEPHSRDNWDYNNTRKSNAARHKSETMEKTNVRFANNIHRVSVCVAGKSIYSQWTLYLGDGLFVSCSHLFLGMVWDSLRIATTYLDNPECQIIADIPRSEIMFTKSKRDRDIVMFRVSDYFPSVYGGMNLQKYIPKTQDEYEDMVDNTSELYGLETDEPNRNRRHKTFCSDYFNWEYHPLVKCNFKVNVDGKATNVIKRDFFKVFDQTTKRGDCTLPYLTWYNNKVNIVGIHFAGKGNTAFGTPLVMDDFDVESIRQPVILSPHLKSMLDETSDNSKPVPGHIPVQRVKKQYYYKATGPNHIRESPLRKWLRAEKDCLPDPCNVMPTICQFRTDKDGIIIDPMTKTNIKRKQTKAIPMPEHLAHHYVMDEGEYVFGGLVKPLNKPARKFAIEEPFWDPVRFLNYEYPIKPPPHSSSSGSIGIYNRRFKDKTKLYGRDIEPDEELVSLVQDTIDAWTDGTDIVFCAPEALKRELYDIVAVMRDKKCRTFNVGDLVLNISLMCVFGPMMYAVKCSSPDYPLVYGYNPHSVDSQHLFKPFERDDGHINMEDLSSQDIFTQKWFAELFAWFAADVCCIQRDDDLWTSYRYAARSVVNLLWLRGRDLYATCSGHGSGTSITSIFNSVNRYICNKDSFEAKYDVPYESVIISRVHGDDSLEHVPEEYSEYDMTWKRDYYRDVLGFIITAADKMAELQPTATRSDVEFLGRSPNTVNGIYCAKLRMDSITGMLNYVSGEIPEREAMEANLRAAQGELVYHGEKVFNEYKSIFDKFNAAQGGIYEIRSFEKEWYRLKYNWTRLQDCQL